MDMETILEETVATEDLKKFEQKYHVELNNGKVSSVQCNIDYRSRQSLSLSMLGVW